MDSASKGEGKQDPSALYAKYDKKVELYKILRSQIEHEDSLINHRLTWLLLTQAFLFAGYFTTINAFLDKAKEIQNKSVWFLIILFLIPVGGICLVFFSFKSILGAFEAVKGLRRYWYGNFPEEGVAHADSNWNFPNIDVNNKSLSVTKELPEITFVGDISERRSILDKSEDLVGNKLKDFWEILALMFKTGKGSKTTAFGTPAVIFSIWFILLLLQIAYIILHSC